MYYVPGKIYIITQIHPFQNKLSQKLTRPESKDFNIELEILLKLKSKQI